MAASSSRKGLASSHRRRRSSENAKHQRRKGNDHQEPKIKPKSLKFVGRQRKPRVSDNIERRKQQQGTDIMRTCARALDRVPPLASLTVALIFGVASVGALEYGFLWLLW
jgi:hypothetical protein